MDRKLFGILSGTHITLIFCTALLMPKALSAAATYGNVAITDPTSGVAAIVDPKSRLRVYDPIAGYTNNPSKIVNATISQSANDLNRTIYAVPVGTALLIKSLTFSHYGNDEGSETYVYLSRNGALLYEIEDEKSASTVIASFDSPIIAREGDIKVNGASQSKSAHNYILLQGYLVPADAVPPPASSEASAQIVNNSGPAGSGRP